MKLKDGFVLRNIAGSNIVVPTGDRCLDFNGMITLNDTGAFIWKCLEEGKDEAQTVEAILSEYDVDQARAEECVKNFVAQLREGGCLE